MNNGFSRISLVIDLEEDWYEPNTLVIRWPAGFNFPKSRVIMHETLHWWQQLGQGFMTSLAAEEWRKLKEFEASGRLRPAGPFLEEFLRVDETVGISAWRLNEALTRYWEFHICGVVELLRVERKEEVFPNPELWNEFDALERAGKLTGPDGTSYTDLAYSLAMRGAGGRYALPYQMLIDMTSAKLAGIVFPIAVHFAFQTTRPTRFFLEFLKVLVPAANTMPGGKIEDLWMEFYYTARNLIFPIIHKSNERPLFPIVEIRETGLCDHPGYDHALNEMQHCTARLRESGAGKDASRRLPEMDEKLIGLLALDIYLATPGIPEHRSGLLSMLPPHLVRFADGRNWLLGYQHRLELWPDASDEERQLPVWKRLGDRALEIDDRWRTMLDARYVGAE